MQGAKVALSLYQNMSDYSSWAIAVVGMLWIVHECLHHHLLDVGSTGALSTIH